MEVVGAVVRLQVQRSRLKPGPRGARTYDPSPLLEVDALHLAPDGVTGPAGEVDVHSVHHPDSRARGGNALSLMTTGQYAALRDRWGSHLADGVAGEGVLVDSPLRELAGPLALETDAGLLALDDVAPIPPCVEFTRWVLGREDPSVDEEVLAVLEALERSRGWYATLDGTGVVRRGMRLLRR